MEEISTQPEERKIDIAELKGEPVDFNPAQAEEIEGRFRKEFIHAPDDYTLDKTFSTRLLDGITEGALKNLITISKERIRVYKVTEDSIKLLSCFGTPFRIEGPRINAIQDIKAIANKSNCSIQVFHYSNKNNRTAILRLDPSTGGLIYAEELDLLREAELQYAKKLHIAKPKNSKIDEFLTVGLFLKNIDKKSLEIGKLRRGRLLRWMYLNKAIENKVAETVKKFEEKRRFELRGDHRANFVFSHSNPTTAVLPYSQDHPERCLVISSSSSAILCFLVNLRKKKILRSRSFTILDLMSQREIDEAVSDPLWRDPEEEDQEEENGQNIGPFKTFLLHFAYLPKSNSFFILSEFGKLQIVFKLKNLFFGDLMKDKKMMKSRRVANMDPYRHLSSFGDDRLLTFYSGEVRSTFLRPLPGSTQRLSNRPK